MFKRKKKGPPSPVKKAGELGLPSADSPNPSTAAESLDSLFVCQTPVIKLWPILIRDALTHKEKNNSKPPFLIF
jgi:hypothetical protein